ncbi:MAG: 2-dehydro-3-deoxygluconokinase, partial [SAR324 cluster bacterium]|nr:2-dehydro-3-deoxygluconokinase [SAR324 cluster bacterium]
MIDILCLGEPLLEFNEQQPGQYVRSIGGDVSNVAVA